jgi:hypothetical protein
MGWQAALFSCALLLIAPAACTAHLQENTSAPPLVDPRQDASVSSADAPVFKTPAWSRIDRERLERETKLHPGVPIKLERRPGGLLLLRRESTAGGALLLKHSALDSIYRYDPRTKNLSSGALRARSRAEGRSRSDEQASRGAALSPDFFAAGCTGSN